MPLYYVGKALEALGVKQSWDGRTWNVTMDNSFTTDFSDISVGTGTVSIDINGKSIKKVNSIAAKDPAGGKNAQVTTYVPIWYVQQILDASGVTNGWNGSNWSVTYTAPQPASVNFAFGTGFNSFVSGEENEYTITATTANVPQTELVRYKSTFTKADGTPVANETISYQDATGAWQTFTTDANGVAYFGPTTGFKTSDIGLDKGVTSVFKSAVADAGDYTLTVALVDAATDATVGRAGVENFTVAQGPVVTFTFARGFDTFKAGQANDFTIAAKATNLPQGELVHYKATLTQADGTPVANQVIGYQDATGPQTFTTDANGVAYFGPAAGFDPVQVGLDQGITTPFNATVATAGDYILKVELVDATTGATVGTAGTEAFSVQ